jgi:signal transduction histidine kinase
MAEGLRWIRRSDRMDLIRSRRMTDEVFKALPSAIAVLDTEGRVEVSTQSARDLFGLKPGVLIKELNLNWLHNLVRLAMDENRKEEIDSANGFIQQFSANNEYFFQPVALPIHTEVNREEITGVIVVFKDVTQLHEQQELKRSVVSTVSHQLKTPLTSIRMSVHLLLEERMGTLNEKQTDLLMTAREDSERLSTILDDLLDLNRIESGKALLDIKPTSVHSLINDAVESFSVDARDKGIMLEGAVTDDFSEVLADAARIHHVFANLLTNALRFTDAGGSITISAEDRPDSVCFGVRDTGKGIPKDYLNFLFNQFYRVPGQKGQTGVGLGLAIVKQIVTAHGGDVGAESAPGRGANFWFTLPKADGKNQDQNSTEKGNQRRK